ncbi:GlsB/YeaQ/YmgE family stress response membrane protein [Rubinisphaera margarita]|uniref:GlsB/YeaQ/YmgE family stress response membrane protein n=1 Tax=Rubinisphaera margarita TaxID=2909586 RepID=UPI001EE91C4E|nr:GlsB/YeaQ/YmgE family stress response membrane protein [Rubinisphaera margarita]MCG6157443.1 GlsB/YeaQ/YmgE family stress response membrane protein [Rubinisphaera margarita]
MSVTELILLLIVAGICGSIGQGIAGYSRTGCLGSIALGFIGALFGAWISKAIGLPEVLNVRFGDMNFPIIWSIAGSAIFVAVLSLFTRRRVR